MRRPRRKWGARGPPASVAVLRPRNGRARNQPPALPISRPSVLDYEDFPSLLVLSRRAMPYPYGQKAPPTRAPRLRRNRPGTPSSIVLNAARAQAGRYGLDSRFRCAPFSLSDVCALRTTPSGTIADSCRRSRPCIMLMIGKIPRNPGQGREEKLKIPVLKLHPWQGITSQPKSNDLFCQRADILIEISRNANPHDGERSIPHRRRIRRVLNFNW